MREMFVRDEKLPRLAQLMSCEERRHGKITEVISWLWWPCSLNVGRLPSWQKQPMFVSKRSEIKIRGRNFQGWRKWKSLDSSLNLLELSVKIVADHCALPPAKSSSLIPLQLFRRAHVHGVTGLTLWMSRLLIPPNLHSWVIHDYLDLQISPGGISPKFGTFPSSPCV